MIKVDTKPNKRVTFEMDSENSDQTVDEVSHMICGVVRVIHEEGWFEKGGPGPQMLEQIFFNTMNSHFRISDEYIGQQVFDAVTNAILRMKDLAEKEGNNKSRLFSKKSNPLS